MSLLKTLSTTLNYSDNYALDRQKYRLSMVYYGLLSIQNL